MSDRRTISSRLLQGGTLAGSIGVYVPATVLQKGLGLVRLILFAWLMAGVQTEYYLWTAGAMIFDILAPVVCLGSNSALARYVSHYEARGLLREFYGRVRWLVLGLSLALTLLAAAGAPWIRQWAIDTDVRISAAAGGEQLLICWAALANVLAVAIHLNLLGFLYGLRAYRLASLVEVIFSVLFTVFGCAALTMWPTGLAVLLAHLAAVVAAMVFGLVVLHRGLRSLPAGEAAPESAAEPPVEPAANALEVASGVRVPVTPAPRSAAPDADSGLAGAVQKVLRFGIVALGANILWNVLAYVSYRLTALHAGEQAGAVFQFYLRLDQQIVFLSSAVWAAVYSHVARRWEAMDRERAMLVLQTAYKAVAVGTMTLSVLIYVTAPVWVLLLPAQWRQGAVLVAGLLMFFQGLVHLSLLDLLSKLHERPWAMVLAGAAAVAANYALARWWLGLWGPAGAALAAGVGIYVASAAVTIPYVRLSWVKLDRGVHVIYLLPILLLLPAWAAAAAWAAVLALCLLTPWLIEPKQKRMLRDAVAGLLRRRKG